LRECGRSLQLVAADFLTLNDDTDVASEVAFEVRELLDNIILILVHDLVNLVAGLTRPQLAEVRELSPLVGTSDLEVPEVALRCNLHKVVVWVLW
jgi:hypothetical protein